MGHFNKDDDNAGDSDDNCDDYDDDNDYDNANDYDNDIANDFDFDSVTPMCELWKPCWATGRVILAKPVLSQICLVLKRKNIIFMMIHDDDDGDDNKVSFKSDQ